MKKFASTMLVMALAVSALSLVMPQMATAADIKPVITVSFAGYEEVRANIEAIGKLGGNAQLAQNLEGLLNMMTQGKGLNGLDKKAPWGAIVELSEQGEPSGFAFLPITDLKQFVEVVKGTPAGADITEKDGVYEFANPQGETGYIAQRGKVAVVVKDKAALDGIPDDPNKFLGDLPSKYLVAIQADVKNVSESLRNQALGFIQMMSQMSMTRTEEETDEQFALREKTTKRSIEKVEMLIKETERIVIGLNIDRSTNKISLDVEVVGQEGSKLAVALSKSKPGKTDLAGFDLPGAALVMNSVGTMTDEDVADAKDTFKSLQNTLTLEIEKQELTESQMKLVKEMLADAVNIANKNLETKKSDVGAGLLLDPSAVTLVAGAGVAEGKPIEDLVKKFFDAAKEEQPDVAELVKFNAETYKGVRLHTLSVPLPEDAEALKPFVGDTLDVVLGVGDNQAFVAAGRDAAKVLKQVIDKAQADAGKEVLPFQMSISALQLAKFVAEVAPDEDVKGQAQMAAGMLAQTSGKDHLLVTVQDIPNGMKIHLELEEGFMQLLGNVAKTIMPGG